MDNQIPILYCYIYRNIKNGSNQEVIVTINSIIPLMRKVVHTCPRLIQTEIFKELEEFGLIKRIGMDKCLLLNNKEVEKRLKEYAFPIHP
jgi:hypothetical protein